MILPNLEYESQLWLEKKTIIAGIDEAGRGAWCGPVTAGAVILPASSSMLNKLYGVRDSKLMTARQREKSALLIKEMALDWQVGLATHTEIDALGIVAATRLAMQRAIAGLHPHPEFLLIDAVKLPQVHIPQKSIIKGDQHSLSIAAASVLAKTTRDAYLIQMAKEYPGYGFERHKGYGTRLHQHTLHDLGPCPIPRQSFAPLKKLLNGENEIQK
jgi:ribonuclease HII